jgi:glyoxylase-like metal-dependent hydrolase (beta-lactamase superfamily II)
MIAPTLTFHGAAGTVTGSCFEIAFARRHVLVDCGLFQGPRSLEALNFERFAFAPGRIDAVLLTHAHLDHCGLLPRLAAKGFHAAFAGIALPNDGSVGLHEAMGFTPVGIYREVGWKLGGWRDVGWWQRLL